MCNNVYTYLLNRTTTDTHANTQMHTHIHSHTTTRTDMQLHIYTYIHAHTNLFTYMYMLMFIHTKSQKYAHLHTRKHTRTHTHVHTRMPRVDTCGNIGMATRQRTRSRNSMLSIPVCALPLVSRVERPLMYIYILFFSPDWCSGHLSATRAWCDIYSPLSTLLPDPQRTDFFRQDDAAHIFVGRNLSNMMLTWNLSTCSRGDFVCVQGHLTRPLSLVIIHLVDPFVSSNPIRMYSKILAMPVLLLLLFSPFLLRVVLLLSCCCALGILF